MAFTFRDQPELQLTHSEIEAMLEASDDVAREAYSRMTLSSSHRWARHTESETAFIRQHLGVNAESSILDVGCGAGRHSLKLAQLASEVVGLDYSDKLIDLARKAAEEAGSRASFHVADFRTTILDRHFDHVLCLYDVIGSFAAPAENLKLLRNLRRHLKVGGTALISVMNGVMTQKNAKYRFSLSQNAAALQSLRPSNTMESTGSIFDPDFYMIDDDSGVVYRKEQFSAGTELPAELIVRDRRYSPQEITSLCAAVGLKADWLRCVRAGDWETNLAPDDDRAKELLVLCRAV